MKRVNKNLLKVIIGLIIIGLCIMWIIRIYWPIITGERSYLGLAVLGLMAPYLGIINGGFLMFYGICLALESKMKSKRKKSTFLKTFPYICTKCGTFSNLERE